MSPTASFLESPSVNMNGAAPALRPGMYAPIPTFFYPDTEELDLETTKAHVVRIASAGVGPVLLGSMGEATHLTHDERNEVVRAGAQALKSGGFSETLPLIVGCGAGSTKETLQLCAEAKEAGAAAAMVISPGYFVGALDRDALLTFFTEVVTKSPLPIILYNYPGASAGIDLDSDFIIKIMDTCPNAIGVKLTCGSVGKLSRLAAHPRNTGNGGDFHVLNGFTDHVLPSASVRTAGAITGFANVCPKMSVRLYELSAAACAPGAANPKVFEEAIKLQGLVSHGDWVMAKAGISGTKYLLKELHGYGGYPRRPILPFKEEKKVQLHKDMAEVLAYERSL